MNALITGASGGIGEELACTHGIRARVLAADLADPAAPPSTY